MTAQESRTLLGYATLICTAFGLLLLSPQPAPPLTDMAGYWLLGALSGYTYARDTLVKRGKEK